MMTSDAVRAKASTFELSLRGFHPDEVESYLARIALVFEVLGHESGPLPAIPAEASPDAIRRHGFTTVWRGFDTDEVAAYLDEVATELEKRLARDPTPPPTTVEFGSGFRARLRDGQASGLFRDAEIVTGSYRRSVTFCTPEGMARDLAARLEGADTCLVDGMIIVAEITPEAMKGAVKYLVTNGHL